MTFFTSLFFSTAHFCLLPSTALCHFDNYFPSFFLELDLFLQILFRTTTTTTTYSGVTKCRIPLSQNKTILRVLRSLQYNF